jgi:membrane protein implicated in regulation of membrane protease activity
MYDIVIFWGIIAGLLIVIELFTTTFYALALALGALVTAGYAKLLFETEITLAQAFVFLITSVVFGYYFPKYFKDHEQPPQKIWIDRYLNYEVELEKAWKGWRIFLDGVSYKVHANYHKPEHGDRVTVTTIRQGEIYVEKNNEQ